MLERFWQGLVWIPVTRLHGEMKGEYFDHQVEQPKALLIRIKNKKLNSTIVVGFPGTNKYLISSLNSMVIEVCEVGSSSWHSNNNNNGQQQQQQLLPTHHYHGV